MYIQIETEFADDGSRVDHQSLSAEKTKISWRKKEEYLREFTIERDISSILVLGSICSVVLLLCSTSPEHKGFSFCGAVRPLFFMTFCCRQKKLRHICERSLITYGCIAFSGHR